MTLLWLISDKRTEAPVSEEYTVLTSSMNRKPQRVRVSGPKKSFNVLLYTSQNKRADWSLNSITMGARVSGSASTCIGIAL